MRFWKENGFAANEEKWQLNYQPILTHPSESDAKVKSRWSIVLTVSRLGFCLWFQYTDKLQYPWKDLVQEFVEAVQRAEEFELDYTGLGISRLSIQMKHHHARVSWISIYWVHLEKYEKVWETWYSLVWFSYAECLVKNESRVTNCSASTNLSLITGGFREGVWKVTEEIHSYSGDCWSEQLKGFGSIGELLP